MQMKRVDTTANVGTTKGDTVHQGRVMKKLLDENGAVGNVMAVDHPILSLIIINNLKHRSMLIPVPTADSKMS
jgi:hypothetical protein